MGNPSAAELSTVLAAAIKEADELRHATRKLEN